MQSKIPHDPVVGTDREISAGQDAADPFVVVQGSEPDIASAPLGGGGEPLDEVREVGGEDLLDGGHAGTLGIIPQSGKGKDPYGKKNSPVADHLSEGEAGDKMIMHDKLRDKLRAAIRAAGTSATALALALNRDDGYIRDYLRGKKATLGTGEWVDIERFLRLSAGTLTSLMASDANRVGVVLNTTDDVRQEFIGSRSVATNKIPVYGVRSKLNRGALFMEPAAVDYTDRPSSLEAVPNAFAFYFPDDSMAPRYFAGEKGFVHPAKPVTEGSFVLVQLVGEPPLGFPRRVVSMSAADMEFEQFSPARTEKIRREDIFRVDRIVASSEP